MRLGNEDGQDWLRLGLSGYQFPDAEDVRKRCSWHVVAGEASCPKGRWKFRSPALTCDESARFTDWLRMAADWLEAPVSAVPAGTDFIEPNLSFSVNHNRDGGGLMIVALNLESPVARPVRNPRRADHSSHTR
jgi:hypothetical protein